MRTYRTALFAGWVVVSLLAVAGFAAFSAQEDEGAELPASDVRVGADLGRNAGAVSALAFAYVVDSTEAPVSTVDLDAAVQRALHARVEQAASEDADDGSGVTSSGTFIRSRYMSEAQVRELVSRYFRPEDVTRAVRIAWCESSFNPRSVNPVSGASGLFQHLPQYWSERSSAAGFQGADIFDPEANVAVAAWLLYEMPGGWSHWACTA